MSEHAYVEINAENFNHIMSQDLPVVVDFWATWCGPCKMIAPEIEELAADYAGKAIVAKCNVDDEPAIAEKFGIMSIPSILFFKEGKLQESVVGFRKKAQLESVLSSLL